MSFIAGQVGIETSTRWQGDRMFRRGEGDDQGVFYCVHALWYIAVSICAVSDRGQKISRHMRSERHAN